MSQWVSSVLLVDWFSELRNAFREDSAIIIKLLYMVSMEPSGSMVCLWGRVADKGIIGAFHE